MWPQQKEKKISFKTTISIFFSRKLQLLIICLKEKLDRSVFSYLIGTYSFIHGETSLV